MNTMRTAIVLLAGSLLMAGCQKGPPAEDPATTENMDNIEVVEPETNISLPAPENMTNVTNAANAAAPPPKISEDVQTRDDADATGMTARLPEDETMLPGQGENQTRPAD
jgi:hypothetical protein